MAYNPFEEANQEMQTSVDPGLFDGEMSTNNLAVPEINQVATPQVETPLEINQTEMPPETEMAGLGILGKLINPGPKVKVRPDSLKKKTEIGPAANIGDFVVIREANPEEILDFNTMTGRTSGAPSPTAAQQKAGIPVTEFNLENIKGPDDLKATIDKTAEIWKDQGKLAGRGEMTHKEILALAKKQGMDHVVERLLRGTSGFKLSTLSEDITSSLQAITSSAMELNRLAKLATETTDKAVLLKFRQHMAFHSALQSNMKGAQMEVARALGSFRIPRTGTAIGDAKQISDLINEFGGENSVKELAELYLAAPTQAHRNRFSGSVWNKVKGAYMEFWINGLLSAPPTHMANMFGNLAFTAVRLIEKAGGGAIGAARRAFGSKTPSIYMSEVASEYAGFVQGLADGWAIAGQAWKTEAPVRDLTGKIMAQHRRAITADNLLPESAPDIIKQAMDFLGVAARLPGRALMTEDEFFKGVNYRMALNGLIDRKARQLAIDGADKKTIHDQIVSMLNDPPEEIASAAERASQIATFTNPVDGLLGQIGATAQSNILGRLTVPFFKTIANIAIQAGERTPLGLAKLYKNADPIERDMIIARATLGTTAMVTAGSFYYDGRITGSGPTDYTLRKQMEDIGWKRWSLVFPKEGVENPRWLQVGHQRMLHPEDVDYVSYHRMEPISIILATASDIAEQIKYPTVFDEEIEDIAAKSIGVVFNYTKDQTFLKSLSTVADLFGSNARKSGMTASGLIENLVSSAVPYSSALSMLERLTDPASDSVIANPDDPLIARQIFAGLRRMETKLPFYNTDLPPVRDIFGKPRLQKGIKILEAVLPPFLADILGDDEDEIVADPVKIELVRIGLPVRTLKKNISGFRLTEQQYDDYVMYAAEPDGMPTLYEQFKETMNDPAYQQASTADQQKIISSIRSLYNEYAKLMMIEEPVYEELYTDLRKKIREQDKLIQIYGRQIQ